MTKEQKVAQAQKLRAKGLLYREIGEQMGVATAVAYRLANPEKARGYTKKTNARRSAAKRQWEREKAGRCEDCGAGLSKVGARLCTSCFQSNLHRKQVARVQEFSRLREEGLKNGEIAKAAGTTRAAVTAVFSRAKEQGLKVPRSPYFRAVEG